MKKGKAAILIVDADETIRTSICNRLQDDGYICSVAADNKQILDTTSTQYFDVILLDMDTPGFSGINTLPQLITDYPNTCIMMTSATDDTQTAIEAIQLGAHDFIAKPLDIEKLEQRVDKALERKKVSDEYRNAQLSQFHKALKESEYKFQLLSETMSDGFFVVQGSRIIFANDRSAEILGYTVDEILGKTVQELTSPEIIEHLSIIYRKRLHNNTTPPDYEIMLPRKDGFLCPIELSVRLINHEGKPAASVIIKDVSSRKKAEEKLRLSEERYRLIADNATDVIFTTDFNFKLTYISPSVERERGFTIEEALARPFEQSFTPASLKHALNVLSEELALENRADTDLYRTRTEIYEVYHKDGSTRWAEIRTKFLHDENGHPTGILGVSRDVTKRIKAENALRKSEAYYRLLAENVTDVIWTMDMNLNLTFVSPSTTHITGFTVEENMACDLSTHLDPKSTETIANIFIEMLKPENINSKDTSKSWSLDGEVYCKDGSTKNVEIKLSILRDEDGNAIGFLGITRDITKRIQSERALKESEERYRLIAENASDVIWTMNMDIEFTYISPTITQQRGYTVEEAMTHKVQDIMTPESFKLVAKELGQELTLEKEGTGNPHRIRTVELDYICKDGSTVPVELTATFLRDNDGKAIGIVGMTRDIRERKKAEKALKESEERYRLLAEHITDVIWIMDLNLQYVYLSPSVERLRGFTVEEAMTQTVEQSLTPASLANAIKLFGEEMAIEASEHKDLNRSRTIELEMNCKDGSTVPVELTALFLRDGDGKATGILGVSRNISERKKAEAATIEAEKRYRAIFDNALQMVFIHDQEGRFLDANDYALKRTGYTRQELDNLFFQDIIHPDDVQKAFETIADVMINGPMKYTLELRVITKSGEIRWVDAFVIPLELSDTHYIGLGIAIDNTERKRAEESLANSAHQILAIQEVTTSILSSLDLKEILQRVSDAIVNNLDFEHSFIFLLDEEINAHRGTTYSSKGGDELVNDVQEIIRQTLTQIVIPNVQGYSLGLDKLLESKTHITHYMSDVASPPFTKEECDSMQQLIGANTWVNLPFFVNNRLFGSILAFTAREDVTEESIEPLQLLADHVGIAISKAKLFQETIARADDLKKSEEKVRRLNEDLEKRVIERTKQLEEANKELESFAYSVSHDLRAPLRSIDGFSQMLLEDYYETMDDQAKDYIRRVNTNTRRMTQLIDGLLDLSRMTRAELNDEPVNLSEITRSICEELKHQQPERKVDFLITPNLITRGDTRLLTAVLQNLLGNSWKFTNKRESATIEFGCLSTNGKNTYYIRDNGAGFDMANAEKLFCTFQRLHTSEEFDGTGIGLATVKRIIQRHGGNVWAEGEVNKGAAFYFTL